MNRKKSFLAVFISLIVLIVLLGGAIRIPKVIAGFQDTQLLEHVTEKEFKFSTYELTYESVSDKLYAMAYVKSQGMDIEDLWINETDIDVPSNAELTEYVNNELSKLMGDGMGISISLYEDQLMVRELYSLYAGLEEKGDNLLSGIKIYHLVYMDNGFELEMFVDNEFYTIYGIRINAYNIIYNSGTSDAKLEKRSESRKNIIVYDDSVYDKSTEGVYFSLDIIMNYWDIQDGGMNIPNAEITGINQSTGESYDESIGWAAIRFEEDVELPVEIDYMYNGNNFWLSINVM